MVVERPINLEFLRSFPLNHCRQKTSENLLTHYTVCLTDDSESSSESDQPKLLCALPVVIFPENEIFFQILSQN